MITRITRSYVRGSRFTVVCLLALAAFCLVMSSACASNATTVTPTVPNRKVKTAHLEGQPFEEMLPQLGPSQRSLLLDFAATVPNPVPRLAYPSVVFLEPTVLSPPEGPLVVELSDGYAEVQIGIANPGSNVNQPNVLCLRNAVQIDCTLEVGVWDISLPPETLAFVPTRIPASPGDQLTFLLLAEDEPKRVQLGSQMLWAFVEERPGLPSEFVEAPIHAKVLGGCDIATIVTDASPSDTFHIPGTQKWGTILYVLIQLCEPTGREYVQLVPIVDRTRVIDLPGEMWHSAVRLMGPASVIPVDTTLIGPAQEFQVAVLPLSDEASTALRRSRFTHAVAFSD